MATFTITLGTEAAPVQFTSLGARGNADTYNINGGYLLVDCDTRYGYNGAAAASFGNITLSATLGGSIEFNSTKVKLIPYNTGASTVPAADTVISRSGASGKLIAVYDALGNAPTAAGAAMPASGFIKIREWNSVSYSSGALTGISASATGPEEPAWLEIAGSDTFGPTVNRRNRFKVLGEYFYFRGVTTSGSRATTYQVPSNGNNVYLPGVEVETDVADVYEFYPGMQTIPATLTNIGTEEARGKVCWIGTSGLIRFGGYSTDDTGGYCPPAGRKIRIPNIFFVTCTTTASNVIPNATLATRNEFLTTGGGVIDLEKCCMNWYLNLLQPFSVRLVDFFTLDSMTCNECASPIAWSNIGVAISASIVATALSMSTNLAGGTIDKAVFMRYNLATTGNYVAVFSYCYDFTLTDVTFRTAIKGASSTTGAVSGLRLSNFNLVRPILIGCGRFYLTTCADMAVTDLAYIDKPTSVCAPTVNGVMYLYDLFLSCVRCMFDGVTFPVPNNQPGGGILQIGVAGCADITLRNLGTADTPLEGGIAGVFAATYTQVTTTATGTKTAHGMIVGSVFYVRVCSNTTIITLGLKTVIAVPTANTFTFACVTGSTTGSFTYEVSTLGSILLVAAAAIANNIRLQRVYVRNNRAAISVGDNSTKNVTLDHVWNSDYALPAVAALNAIFREVAGLFPTAAQTSVYGTHWIVSPILDLADEYSSVTWGRSGTTVDVALTNHGLRVGDQIYVHTTSNNTGVPIGQKAITVAASKDVFTFTGVNSGTTSGTISFYVQTCILGCAFNEPTADTTAQVALTGKAAFTSAGTLAMPAANDSAEFIYPGNILNVKAFLNAVPYMAAGTISDYHITYSIDDGTTYHNLQRTIAATSGVNGTYVVGFASTTGIEVGDIVSGTGIAAGAAVQSLDSTTVTLTKTNTATVSGNIVFNHIGTETGLDTANGFPFRIKFVSKAGSATALRNIGVRARRTRGTRYELPLDSITLTITGLPTGTDVVVLSAGTSTILDQQDQISGTTYEYNYSEGHSVDIGFIKPGYTVQYIRNLVLGSANSSIPVALVPDRNYS